jgi:hypothetical protein
MEELSRLAAWYKHHTTLLSNELTTNHEDKLSQDRFTAGYYAIQSYRLYCLIEEWESATSNDKEEELFRAAFDASNI